MALPPSKDTLVVDLWSIVFEMQKVYVPIDSCAFFSIGKKETKKNIYQNSLKWWPQLISEFMVVAISVETETHTV